MTIHQSKRALALEGLIRIVQFLRLLALIVIWGALSETASANSSQREAATQLLDQTRANFTQLALERIDNVQNFGQVLRDKLTPEEAKEYRNLDELTDQLDENSSKLIERLRQRLVDLRAKDLEIGVPQILDTFSDDEIKLLLDFSKSKIGIHYHNEAHPHEEQESRHSQYSENDQRLLAAIESQNLFNRYKTHLGEIIRPFADELETILEQFEADLVKRLEIVLDRSDPESVFSEPLPADVDLDFPGLFTAPFPSTLAYMQQHNIGEEALELDQSDPTPRIGDQLTTLVSFANGKLDKQWLVQILSVEKDEAELNRSREPFSTTKYTTTGNAHTFDSVIGAIQITVIGPFYPQQNAQNKPPAKEVSRALLKTDFLRLGMEAYCEACCRMKDVSRGLDKPLNWDFHLSSEPFPIERVQEARKRVETFKITDEEDRSLAGSFLPQWEFFSICRRTQSLNEIMTKVLKMPSAMAMLANRFETRYTFQYGPRERYYRLPEFAPTNTQTLYSFPLKLNIYDKPALYLRFFPTTPLPPLQLSAGFLGLVATTPGKPERRIIIRVIGGKRGADR